MCFDRDSAFFEKGGKKRFVVAAFFIYVSQAYVRYSVIGTYPAVYVLRNSEMYLDPVFMIVGEYELHCDILVVCILIPASESECAVGKHEIIVTDNTFFIKSCVCRISYFNFYIDGISG